MTPDKQKQMTKTNLQIDLREIKHILETRKNIMASEYIDLCAVKNEIVRRLIKREYINK